MCDNTEKIFSKETLTKKRKVDDHNKIVQTIKRANSRMIDDKLRDQADIFTASADKKIRPKPVIRPQSTVTSGAYARLQHIPNPANSYDPITRSRSESQVPSNFQHQGFSPFPPDVNSKSGVSSNMLPRTRSPTRIFYPGFQRPQVFDV